MADQSYPNAFGDCWSHPIDCLKSIFTPGYSSSGGGYVLSGSPLQTAQDVESVGAAKVRAYGVDPQTGDLFVSNPVNAISAGYDPANGMAFVKSVSDSETAFFQSQYAKNVAALPLLPDLPGLPNLNDASNWLVIGLVLVLAFLLIKAVK